MPGLKITLNIGRWLSPLPHGHDQQLRPLSCGAVAAFPDDDEHPCGDDQQDTGEERAKRCLSKKDIAQQKRNGDAEIFKRGKVDLGIPKCACVGRLWA